jgi:hypothetical protein
MSTAPRFTDTLVAQLFDWGDAWEYELPEVVDDENDAFDINIISMPDFVNFKVNKRRLFVNADETKEEDKGEYLIKIMLDDDRGS